MQCKTNSVGCIQLFWARLGLWSNMQGGKERSWPVTRPAFPRGNKSSCGRPGACQSKAILIMAKAEFRF